MKMRREGELFHLLWGHLPPCVCMYRCMLSMYFIIKAIVMLLIIIYVRAG